MKALLHFRIVHPISFSRNNTTSLKNFFMKNFLFYILLLLTGLSSQAQQLITGKVKNKDNDSSIVGVSVSVKGSSNVTVTDETGSFSLNIPSLPVTLVISHVGFVTEEIVVRTKEAPPIMLEPDYKGIDVIVVSPTRTPITIRKAPTSIE